MKTTYIILISIIASMSSCTSVVSDLKVPESVVAELKNPEFIQKANENKYYYYRNKALNDLEMISWSDLDFSGSTLHSLLMEELQGESKNIPIDDTKLIVNIYYHPYLDSDQFKLRYELRLKTGELLFHSIDLFKYSQLPEMPEYHDTSHG